MVDGITFDPTVGIHIPNPELYMEAIGARSLWGALRRQNKTLENASRSAGIKRRLAQPMNKELTALAKRAAKLDKQIAKATGKERDQLVKDRQQLQERTERLSAQMKEVGKTNLKVKALESENRALNSLNHAQSLFYGRTAYQYSGFLDRYIRETDLTSQDIAASATQFAPPMGLLGLHFAAGGGF